MPLPSPHTEPQYRQTPATRIHREGAQRITVLYIARRGHTMVKFSMNDDQPGFWRRTSSLMTYENDHVYHRRLADMPGQGRALGGRGVPFETPLAGGIAGREALRR